MDCDALIAQVQKQDPEGLVLKDVQKTSGEKTVPPKRVSTDQPPETTQAAPARSFEDNRTE